MGLGGDEAARCVLTAIDTRVDGVDVPRADRVVGLDTEEENHDDGMR
jgi:hypothetical protein